MATNKRIETMIFIYLLPRTGVYDIPGQDVLTRDSVTVRVDAVVFCRVSSPLLAVCGDGDYKVTTRYKAQTAIRNVLGTKNLTQILADRDGISREMVDNLQVQILSPLFYESSAYFSCAKGDNTINSLLKSGP